MTQLYPFERETHISYLTSEPDKVWVSSSNLAAMKRLIKDPNFTVISEFRNKHYTGVDGKGLIEIIGYYPRNKFSVKASMPLSTRQSEGSE